uniref:Glyoxylate reductase n=1 Tax=Mycena chlorophos TaxID=658473 RepID=A0ABQ0LP40_MYCCL|nr:glyoxylate reductase [Mycena chlorophos]
MKKKIVVCTDLGPVLSLLTLRDDLDVVVWPHAVDTECPQAWLLENVQGASGLVVCFKERVDGEVIKAAGPGLRAVSTISVGYVGYDHIDLPLLASRNIQVGYTPDVLTDAVADSAVMLALMASRRTNLTTSVVTSNAWSAFQWTPFALSAPQLSTTPFSAKRTVGFLGFGRIAQAVLRRLTFGFGVSDTIYTPRPEAPPQVMRDAELLRGLMPNLHSLRAVDMHTLAADSDFLFVLAPGGEATRHLIDESFLRRMKPTSVLVNNGRGSVVDSTALAKALKEGWIWGAGLDVIEEEPHVGVGHVLLAEPEVREKCVVVPHLGSATHDTRAEMARLTAVNVLRGVDGEQMESGLDLGRWQ